MSDLMTYSELSDKLQVPVATLRTWVREDKVPYIRLGDRTVRFNTQEIDLWLDHKTIQPSSEKG